MRARPTVLLALVTLSLAGAVAIRPSAGAAPCGRPTGCTVFELISAGSTYGWFAAAGDTANMRRFEFRTEDGATAPAGWTHLGPATSWVVGAVGHGTLRTIAPQTGGTTQASDVVTRWTSARSTGRWEIRYRSRSTRDGRPGMGDYRVQVELVPAGSVQRCEPRSITVVAYDPAAPTVARVGITKGALHLGSALPVTSPTLNPSSSGWVNGSSPTASAWHAWAVEVAPDHVSWFKDGRVVRRETRSAALFHEPLELRLSLLPEKAGTTAKAYSQLDWARWFSLRRTTTAAAAVQALRSAPALVPVPASVNPGCS
ncbi:MAG: hypothetical protein ACJ72E_14590 [Marmoricola sp.]